MLYGIVLFSALGIFLVMFTIMLIRTTKHIDRTAKKLGNEPGGYLGPAGEPRWDGVLPEKVDDYVEPCYVYEDNHECTEPQPEHGRIIGYRISPTLVIHSRTEININSPVLFNYIERLTGKLLNLSDVKVLLQNWDAISDLRVKAGDDPLEKEDFWFTHQGLPVVYSVDRDVYYTKAMSYPECWYLLILKR